MTTRVDILSIGALARNLLWNETVGRRSQHSTCTLIRSEKRTIIVDPGLPAPALAARIFERTGLTPSSITDVFLTHVANDSVAGLELFESARWFCSPTELEMISERAGREGKSALTELVSKLRAMPDALESGIDLYPLPGFSSGTAGLLIASPVTTTLITGPAVASIDHFLAGQVLPDCINIAAAKESLQEVYDIADTIIPGYDNQFQNPRGFGM